MSISDKEAEKACKQLFDIFDVDGNGTLDKAEFKNFQKIQLKKKELREILKNEEKFEKAWNNVDVDFSGHIDYQEFRAIVFPIIKTVS